MGLVHLLKLQLKWMGSMIAPHSLFLLLAGLGYLFIIRVCSQTLAVLKGKLIKSSLTYLRIMIHQIAILR